ncbi:MAG: NUDIX domain-containing protein [Defluviitaleaceae bacterium]|nr:NUDIX domain-containing protein [Defluviitaleaceae bacterium]
MKTRITAGAFLTCGEKILLMKRGLHKKLGPGKWAGIGGHIELTDIKDPRALKLKKTCLREIKEEAGIKKTEIQKLRLRYIAINQTENEIRIHYHHIGELQREIPLPKCSEGEFYWKYKSEIADLPMSITVKEAISHWINNPNSDSIYLVAVNGDIAAISEL